MSQPSDTRQIGFYWVLGNEEWQEAWWGWNPMAFGHVSEIDEDAPYGWWGIADELPGDDESYDRIGEKVERVSQ